MVCSHDGALALEQPASAKPAMPKAKGTAAKSRARNIQLSVPHLSLGPPNLSVKPPRNAQAGRTNGTARNLLRAGRFDGADGSR